MVVVCRNSQVCLPSPCLVLGHSTHFLRLLVDWKGCSDLHTGSGHCSLVGLEEAVDTGEGDEA